MFELLTRKWWVVGLRGLIAVAFGIVALVYPAMTLAFLVYLFGAYALADGLFAVATAIGGPAGHRGWFLLEGIASIACGILAFVYPAITGTTLVYLIGVWAILTGVLEIVAGFNLPVSKDWLLALAGLASIVFGVIVLFNPGAGALAIVGLIGLYGLLFGVTLIVLAFRLRGWHKAASLQTA